MAGDIMGDSGRQVRDGKPREEASDVVRST